MSPWIVAGDRVRYHNNRTHPMGTVVHVGSSVWVRWDNQSPKSDPAEVKEMGKLDVLASARRDRAGRVRGELDSNCLVVPESIGWGDWQDPEPVYASELDAYLAGLFPPSE